MSEHYDLVVIGAGPAGEKGAAEAAGFGKHVCIVERAPRPGGAAVNSSAIPSKTLRETARFFSGIRRRGLYGIDLRVKHDISIGDFMRRERTVVETEWEQIDENLKRHGVDSIQGTAHFADAHTVEVMRYGQPTRRIAGDAILIATGARPRRPDGFDVDGTIVIDSETLLTLQRIPDRMIVVGGGAVGCEYACVFAALGVQVTLVSARSRLLAHLDADVGETLRTQMTDRFGVAVHTESRVAAVAVHDEYADVTLTDGTALAADCLLYSAGRVGHTAELGLEPLGIRTDARGYVQVDARYHTGVGRVYAAGDVIGFPALASTSMEQARAAVADAFGHRHEREVLALAPYGVWTIPEVATVGDSEESLRRRGVPYEVGRGGYRATARGLILGDLGGSVKLLFSPEDRRILGVSVVGDSACELIHVGMACMRLGGTLDFFAESVFTYPSLSEAYRDAAEDGRRTLAGRAGSSSTRGTPRASTPP